MKSFVLTTSLQLVAVFLFLAGSSPLLAQPDTYRLQTVVEGIPVPWGMVWLDNGDMLVSNRAGELYRVSDGNIGQPLVGTPTVHANGQGGLLDIHLHPDYPATDWIYFTYSSREGEGQGSHTALMRARLAGNTLIDKEVLYKGEGNTTRGQHYGSRIAFDDQGYVYFSIGDRGAHFENAQQLDRDGGKIYRLHDDGRIPADNPFSIPDGTRSAVFSYGHRNPQGMDRHPVTGQIWAHEHGPRGGDEVNIIQAGKNYGWPIIGYGINYNGQPLAVATQREGVEQPVWYWDPSIAPSGMTFISSDRYPRWQGKLLVGSLKFAHLVLLELDGNTVTGAETLFEGIGRTRNVRQGPDGYLYVATEGKGIIRIIPE
ncbi:MAG: PQQ-dependent sugar dehydrogenase [Pseudomonadales bacterium]|nr:PQQ-dependent sugar dehydrogenase [Pseudomonadales bacterium]